MIAVDVVFLGLLSAWGAARALTVLGERASPELVSALLGSALRARRIAMARAGLRRLGRARGPEVVRSLVKVLALEQGELAVSAAEALGASGAARAETPLVAALAHAEADVRVAAARALGRAGSVAAVLPLQEAAERHRFDGALRRACRQSVAEIQARLRHASPGQLASAEADAGRLSLAEPDLSGHLSMAATHEPR